MNYNYHTHTYRCHHASGREREYIEAAIAAGVRRMGFSDHAPFTFPDGYQSPFRVQEKDVADYFDTLRALREEYKEKITLLIGFEMEYYPQHFEKMLETAKTAGAEYLILGQHYIGNEHPNGSPTYKNFDSTAKEGLCEYADCVVAGIERGVFTYVAHPDIYSFDGDIEFYRQEMRRICLAAKRTGTPLEINFLGIREKRAYPREAFWQLVGETGAPVTCGMDAHRPKDAGDTASLSVAMKLVEKYDLNYIGEPTPILLQN